MVIAEVLWPAVAGAVSYKLEYKKTADPTWILYDAALPDPEAWIVGLDACTSYDFKVTTNCVGTTSGGTTVSLYTICHSADVSNKLLTQAPIVNPNIWVINNRRNVSFGTSGTRIYGIDDYNLNGTAITTTTDVITPSFLNNVPGNLTEGRLNNVGLWIDAQCITPSYQTLVGEYIGIAHTLYFHEPKTIYIGMGTNSYGKFSINGVDIVDVTSFAADNFNWWHVYPVRVGAGVNVFEFWGIDHGATTDPAFGFEVYDNTEAEIAAAIVDTDVNILFSTSNRFCDNIDLGASSVGVRCSPSYYLDMSDPLVPVCVLIL